MNVKGRALYAAAAGTANQTVLTRRLLPHMGYAAWPPMQLT